MKPFFQLLMVPAYGKSRRTSPQNTTANFRETSGLLLAELKRPCKKCQGLLVQETLQDSGLVCNVLKCVNCGGYVFGGVR